MTVDNSAEAPTCYIPLKSQHTHKHTGLCVLFFVCFCFSPDHTSKKWWCMKNGKPEQLCAANGPNKCPALCVCVCMWGGINQAECLLGIPLGFPSILLCFSISFPPSLLSLALSPPSSTTSIYPPVLSVPSCVDADEEFMVGCLNPFSPPPPVVSEQISLACVCLR